MERVDLAEFFIRTAWAAESITWLHVFCWEVKRRVDG